MKLFILAVLCFGVNAEVLRSGLVASDAENQLRTAIGPIKENGYISNRRVLEFTREHCNSLIDNEEDVLNEDNLVFPCVNNEISCVRQFMANNSCCKPVYGPAPDPFCVLQSSGFLLSSNITVTYSDLEARGLSGARIHTFYYNKKTGYLILSIIMPYLTVSTSRKHFQFKRHGYEPIDRSDCATVTYNNVILTAEIPGLCCGNLYLGLAEIHVYIGGGNPNFYVGPNVYDSTDPSVTAGNTAFLENVPIVSREILLFQSQLFMASYIQTNICDFSVKLSSD